MKLLTWNILSPTWFCLYAQKTYGLLCDFDFNKKRLDNIITSIKTLNPDVLCLQEISYYEINKIIKLGYKLVCPLAFNKNMANEGVATLIRTNMIKNIQTYEYGLDDVSNEPYVYCTISNIKILNIHLPRGGNTYTTLVNIIEKIKNIPTLVVGDFNCSELSNKELYALMPHYLTTPTNTSFSNIKKFLLTKKLIDTCDTEDLLKNKSNLYTTIKNKYKDHEDHIFINTQKHEIKNIYYGDYIKKLNKKTINQKENGLIYLICANKIRKNWNLLKNKMTSDHRWIFIELL